MCTIGNVFIPESNGLISFKQCDLEKKTEFIEPIIEQGLGDIKYLPFKRVGSNGPWAGVNNYGVSFVAADAYLEVTDKHIAVLKGVDQDIFAAYTKIISDCKTAQEAAVYMSKFYKSFKSPDILLINDATSSYFIETNEDVVECIERTDLFFASTNHFRMLYGGVLYPMNHSSYLRLVRAEAALEKNTNAQGPFNVLKDQYFGETVFSICRVNSETPPQESPYYTQATALFFTDGHTVNCAYQLNGNPRTNPYTLITDVFGTHTVSKNISIRESKELLTKV
ncbi:hypothetical protein ACOCEA_09545 [Maribacter sp. CXY002]|uniref:hypothetical protein n=1 Tax=Maribacter luteocoastalis TaxID=3407671 RepID=UPI003B676FBE